MAKNGKKRRKQAAKAHEVACPICGCTCWTGWSLKVKERMAVSLREQERSDIGCPLCGCETVEDALRETHEAFAKVVADHVARQQLWEAQPALAGEGEVSR